MNNQAGDKEEVLGFDVTDEALEESSGLANGEMSQTPYGTTAANCGDCRKF
jgi:hypothetical protein